MHYLCLNMIVRDESHIIEKTLRNLLEKIPEIDYYVISDTGSVDDTVDIIHRFFSTRGVKGEIHHDKWVDFGSNRTKALDHALGKSEYLLIFDADDEIVGNFRLPNLREYKTIDAFALVFGPIMLYDRVLIVNNQIRWRFRGVLHEYIECVDKKDYQTASLKWDGYHIVSGRSGSRNRDPQKYTKDAMILEAAFEKAKQENDDIYNRYGYYIAQSYFDANNIDKAIEWHEKVFDLGCWIQEKYWCCLRLYQMLCTKGRQKEGMYYLVKSFQYDKTRYECVYELMKHYCANKSEDIAWMYYNVFRESYERVYLSQPVDVKPKLFFNTWYGDFGFPYMVIIASINTQHYDTAVHMYRIIFEKKYKEKSGFHIGCLIGNFRFLIDKLGNDKEKMMNTFRGYVAHLHTIGYPIENHQDVLQEYGVWYSDSSTKKQKIKCIKSKNILIYTGYAPKPWNHTYYKNHALGGSETVALQLGMRMSKEYKVFIVGTVEEETVGNLTFVHMSNAESLIKDRLFYAVIVSRYLDFFHRYSFQSFKTFIWAHDTLMHTDHILDTYNKRIDGCICLTEWHKKHFETIYPVLKDRIVVIPNGVEIDIPQHTLTKKPNRFIYSSCPERGLDRVLVLWERISKEFNDAELIICSYNDFPRNAQEEDLMAMMKKFPSVKFKGSLGKDELYRVMQTCEYWLYPTCWQETSCLTAMEMMANQVLCLYYPVAGLPDTIGEGNGVPLRVGEEIETILSLTRNRKDDILRRASEHVNRYKWPVIYTHWERLLRRLMNA